VSKVVWREYPICKDQRGWCVNSKEGHCLALSSTYGESKKCPFYKKYENNFEKSEKK